MLLSFVVAGVLRGLLRLSPTLVFSLAGAFAIAVMLMAMHPLLHVTLIAGARSPMGFTCQCLAGAIGGYVFSCGLSHAMR